MERSLSFSQTRRERPKSATVSHRAITPTARPSKAHLEARADPKGFFTYQWPVQVEASQLAGSLIKEAPPRVVAPPGMRRPRSAAPHRRMPDPPAVSFAPYRKLQMPEPMPGDWWLRTQYDNGAFQLGVIHYPYTQTDRPAQSDIEGFIHRALDHPSVPLNSWNGTSAPHNSVTGRATTSRYGIDMDSYYKSESQRAYEIGDFTEYFVRQARIHSVGVRSEQRIDVTI
ncbi:hypothetical protein T492DRAFT_987775 [Pavlovales sp. CCMP2436]|nr:hypothetical protein T492DRAFT_987775 [Pavlovales sp. CCMP2436]